MKSSEEERLENEVRRLRGELDELRAILAGGDDESLQHVLSSLRESEDRHRSVVAALSEGVVLQSADGTILTCNAAAERILGLSVDQMMGRTSLDPRWRAIHPDGSEFAGETHPAMVTLRTGAPQRSVPMGVHKPDGTLTWIMINTQPLRREPREPPYAVVSSFTDVTKFREIQEALERSARQLRLALSSARAGVWEWNVRTGEVWWSEDVEGIFGLGPGEFDGSFESYLALVHPQDRARVQEEIQRALDVPEIGEQYQVEHRVRRPDGAVRWIHGSGAVVRDESGGPLCMTGAVLDVTHSKDLEHRLLHVQKMESIGRLAGGVAHDFNNLLTAILGSADIGLAKLDDPEQLRSLLADIRDAAQQGSRVTRQLLTFARKQDVSLRPLRVGSVVSEAKGLLARLLGDHIELEVGCEDHSSVIADAGLIEQVLVNLCVNAGDAMPTGGRLRVQVRDVELDTSHPTRHPGARPGPHVRLVVEDTGTGIEPGLLDKIFEPFFTTKEQGTGLGLATCYAIVDQLGGHLAVDSRPGEGTAVCVCLPASEAGPGEQAEETMGEPARGTETVLFVEDDDLVRRLGALALEGFGYQVLPAADPAEALEVAAGHGGSIHLLVSDVLMPGSSGVELAERLLAERPELRVLLASGYPDQQLQPVIGGRPPNLLPKPYRVAELGRRVREILDAG